MSALFDGRVAGRASPDGAPRMALLVAALVAVAGCSDSTKSAAPDAGHAAKPDASVPDASVSEGVEQIQIEVGDLTFDARAAGPADGELVLFLHGFPETSYEWRHQLAPFARAGYRAVAPDQRGYSPGARPPSVDDYNILLLAQDVVGMAGALGATRYHVVGHDWGAAVAWTVAKLDADHVITVNPMSVPHPDAFTKQLADMQSCQYSASSCFDTFTMPNSEDGYLAGDAGLLRALYTPTDFMSVDEQRRTHQQSKLPV